MTRRHSRAALVLIAVLTLTGCLPLVDPIPRDGPIALRVENGDLAIAVCQSIRADQVRITEKRNLPDASWIEIWAARDVDKDLGHGDSLRLAEDFPADAVRAFRPPALEPGDQLLVTMETTTESGDVVEQIAGYFEVPRYGLSDELWQRPDGSVMSEPCAADQ